MRRFDFARLQTLGAVAAFGLIAGLLYTSPVVVAQMASPQVVNDAEKSPVRSEQDAPASQARDDDTPAQTSEEATAPSREPDSSPILGSAPVQGTAGPVEPSPVDQAAAPTGAAEPPAGTGRTPGAEQAASAPAAAPDAESAKKAGRDAEGRLVVRLNPLQTARPDRNIVVCEGGCGGTRVVYDGAKAAPAGEAGSVNAPKMNATCRGGCYASPPGHTWAGYDPSRGVTVSVPAPHLLAGEGQWMTSVTPGLSAVPDTSAKPGIMAAPSASPQAKPVKIKRDDWMARINREREAEKAAKLDAAVE